MRQEGWILENIYKAPKVQNHVAKWPSIKSDRAGPILKTENWNFMNSSSSPAYVILNTKKINN